MVETVPPLLGAGARFAVAGALMLAVLALRRGWPPCGRRRASCWARCWSGCCSRAPTRSSRVAEQEVPSGLAALLIASVPLWVILLRRVGGRAGRARAASPRCSSASPAWRCCCARASSPATRRARCSPCVGAAVMWATGSFASPRVALPRDPLVSTGWQMLLGGR